MIHPFHQFCWILDHHHQNDNNLILRFLSFLEFRDIPESMTRKLDDQKCCVNGIHLTIIPKSYIKYHFLQEIYSKIYVKHCLCLERSQLFYAENLQKDPLFQLKKTCMYSQFNELSSKITKLNHFVSYLSIIILIKSARLIRVEVN